MKAWRVWQIGPQPGLYSPGQPSKDNNAQRPWPGRREMVAVCLPMRERLLVKSAPHSVPDADCDCGIRGVLDLRNLFRYYTSAEAKGRVVYGVVDLRGELMWEYGVIQSIRAERCAVTGPLFIGGGGKRSPLRKQLAMLYGVEVRCLQGDVGIRLRGMAEKAAGDDPWTPEAVLGA